ncbi:MAG: hypothetical protein R3A46_19370 [Thermomicrobiales bacterium]
MIQGWAHGFRGAQMMPLRADYFGRQAFGKIMGFTFMFMMWGEVGGPLAMGLIVDGLGDYRLGFGLLGFAALIATFFFAISSQPSRPTAIATATVPPS